jgi:hypothetical protein
MTDIFKTLIKQPYSTLALIAGVLLVTLPSITIDKDHWVAAHPPTTYVLVVIGVVLVILSAVGFWLTLPRKNSSDPATAGQGLDLTRVQERDGVLWTNVSGCDIRVVAGRLEEQVSESGTVVVLPCNEYFDDRCAGDTKSALGAYVNKEFKGQVHEFISLIQAECARKLGPGEEHQKTKESRARSFGPGKCLLLSKPLNKSTPIALISTTTQRAGEGLVSRISYLFDGMRRLGRQLADERYTEVVMPVLGAGHGRIDPPLALVGLLLAVAEAARYGGGPRLRRVTIVVYKRDEESAEQVDPLVVRRALALIGSNS